MRRKLKILFANSIQMFAGGEVWMLTTMAELRRRGHQVTLLCRPGTELARRAATQGFDLFELKIRGDFDPVSIMHIRRWLQQHPTDIILANMDKELRLCGTAAKLGHGPVVIARRGIDYPLKNKLHYRLTYNYLTRHIVANSQSTKQALLRNAPWLDPRRIQVIYNGIDSDNYLEHNTCDLREALNLSQDTTVIGFVGQLNERKGFDTLLPAFKQVVTGFPGVILLLAGTGDLEQSILDFAVKHQLQENLRLLGFRTDIPNIMRTIDLLVLPSWWEGFGIVLIEALAAGKPCITTNVSSMPEIVSHNETGLIVPPKSVAALYGAIKKLIAQPELRQEMGQRGRQVVQQKFTLQTMVDQYEALFYQLVGEGIN